MSRVFITGSAQGLGLAAARELISVGHEVLVHARSEARARTLRTKLPDASAMVFGDLASAVETKAIAEQVNTIGRMDVVIHNAGIYLEPARGHTPEGHAKVLARQHACALPADGPDGTAGPARLPEQRNAPWRRRLAGRHRLGDTALAGQ